MTNKISQKIIYKYPKILLTGGTGQVGQELRHMLQPLGEVWSPNRKYFNLAESESLRQKIRDYQPDLIVNTAAYTEVDQVELNSELAYSVNVESPRIAYQSFHGSEYYNSLIGTKLTNHPVSIIAQLKLPRYMFYTHHGSRSIFSFSTSRMGFTIPNKLRKKSELNHSIFIRPDYSDNSKKYSKNTL